ncbi:MAG: hypothetical protein CMJ64_27735 [Planctomycetaceae bacterium]|nr:hypothetical protein [Planctomycetaceae bacterium]
MKFLSLAAVIVSLAASSAYAVDPVLPGTSRLTLKRPVDEIMVEGINRFCLRELANSHKRRATAWQRNYSNAAAYSSSIQANRDRFRQIIGATDPRATTGSRRLNFELLSTLEHSSVVAGSKSVTVHAVRWQVLNGVTAEGLLLKPDRIRAAVVALPDADWTPEMFCGISHAEQREPSGAAEPDISYSVATSRLPAQVQFVRRLAKAGCLVAIPTLISRNDEFSGHPDVRFTNQPHREFIYRQAFEVGRHVIGFEVQKVLAAVDLFEQFRSDLPIGVAGVGEGGLIALYAAALDARIDATLVSGYFREREGLWQEPIDRNVWRLLTEFGDAEIAAMVAPRRLVIEACRAVEITGPPKQRPGRVDVAAPGKIETGPLASVVAEHQRAKTHYERLGNQQQLSLIVSGKEGQGLAGSSKALAAFSAGLNIDPESVAEPESWEVVERRKPSGTAAKPDGLRHSVIKDREKQQFDEMQDFVQNLLQRSHKAREAKWKADLSSVENWLPSRDRLRKMVHEELIGRLKVPRTPPNPRSRLVLDTDDYRGYEVVLDVAPDIIAAGILLLPRDLKQNEKRPVVVCQHGLEGIAMDTISREPRAFRAYKAFADELCRRGFIVYAPQNPYRGFHRFRTIQRKANPLGLSIV